MLFEYIDRSKDLFNLFGQQLPSGVAESLEEVCAPMCARGPLINVLLDSGFTVMDGVWSMQECTGTIVDDDNIFHAFIYVGY